MNSSNDNSRAMRDIELDDRPREKALRHGLDSLRVPELLAVIIGSGAPGENVSELCSRILRDHDNKLYDLARRSVQDLVNNYRGIGEVKALEILAALELGRRMQVETFDDRYQVRSPGDAYRYLSPLMADKSNEQIMVMLLNRRREVIHTQAVGSGGVAFSFVDMKMLLKPAIERLADGIILAHNHPSDNPQPSEQDNRLTERVAQACVYVEVALVDHIIVCRGGRYYSYLEQGTLPTPRRK